MATHHVSRRFEKTGRFVIDSLRARGLPMRPRPLVRAICRSPAGRIMARKASHVPSGSQFRVRWKRRLGKGFGAGNSPYGAPRSSPHYEISVHYPSLRDSGALSIAQVARIGKPRRRWGKSRRGCEDAERSHNLL